MHGEPPPPPLFFCERKRFFCYQQWRCCECVKHGRFPVRGDDEEKSGTIGAGDAEDVCEEDDQPSPPSPTKGAEGRAPSTARPRKKGSRAPGASQLRLPQHWHKASSLIWRGVEGVVSELLLGLFMKLCDNYKSAKDMLDQIKKTRTVPDTRTLTLKQIEKALDPDDGDSAFRDVVTKLEKFDYKLYGIKVRCESKLVSTHYSFWC